MCIVHFANRPSIPNFRLEKRGKTSLALEILSFILLVLLLAALATHPILLASASVLKSCWSVCHRWSYGFLKWFKSHVLPSYNMYGVSLTATFQPVEETASKYRENICIAEAENRLDTVGKEKVGWIERVACIETYKLKQAASGDLLCGSGGQIRWCVTTWRGGMGWEEGGRCQREGSYVYFWLTHVDGWQKPTQHCRAIVLQLKINLKKYPDKRINGSS